MDLNTDYIDKFRPAAAEDHAPRSEREEMLVKFLKRLNGDRKADGLEALTPARLATILKGVPTGDLYGFYKSCERARSFTRLFWYLLKPQK